MPVASLRALVRRLENEWYDETESSTPGGRALLGEEHAEDIGHRRGWNASHRSLIGTLVRLCDEHDAPVALPDEEEQRAILEAERVQAEAQARADERERRAMGTWAFEQDIEHGLVAAAYDLAIGGEGG